MSLLKPVFRTKLSHFRNCICLWETARCRQKECEVTSDGTPELHVPGYVPALQLNGYAIFSTVWWLFRYSCCVEDNNIVTQDLLSCLVS